MNLNFFRKWLDVLIKPKETFEKEKKNVSVAKGLLYYFLAFFIGYTILFLSSVLKHEISIYSTSGEINIWLSPVGLPVILLLSIVLTIAVSVLHGFMSLIAKLFGGKGYLEEQYYLTSLFVLPLFLVYAVADLILNYDLSVILGILMILIILYSLYLLILVLSKTYNYGKIRAIITVISFLLISVLPAYLLMAYLSLAMC